MYAIMYRYTIEYVRVRVCVRHQTKNRTEIKDFRIASICETETPTVNADLTSRVIVTLLPIWQERTPISLRKYLSVI